MAWGSFITSSPIHRRDCHSIITELLVVDGTRSLQLSMDGCTTSDVYPQERDSRYTEQERPEGAHVKPDTIEVRELTSDKTKAFVELFFESAKHGGGPTKDVKLEEGTAIITFENPEGRPITDITYRGHLLPGIVRNISY